MTAFIVGSILVIALWIAGIMMLRNASLDISASAVCTSDSNTAVTDYGNCSLLNISETFISCRKEFEQTEAFHHLEAYLDGNQVLTADLKESIKKGLYLSFGRFRPFICTFNGQLSETEFFCFLLTLLKVDNSRCGELLNMTGSSVRSCRSRLRGKLGSEPLRMMYSDTIA